MSEETEILDLKKQIKDNLETKLPSFEENWNEIVKTLGNDFVGWIKESFQKELNFFEDISEFRFSIVIDNNFIFGQIKSTIEKNRKIEDSFIYKLINSKYIDVFAPPKLKEELFDKVNNVLKINNELAVEYSNLLLEEIIIQDAQWIDEWKYANNLIGHIDEDDVPYLALAIHMKSHAIISKDAIFKKQGASKSWNIQETEKIINSYNSGFISFCFIGAGMSILEVIWKTIASIFKVIGEIVTELLYLAGIITIGAIDLIVDKIPPWLSISALVGLAISAALSKDLRNSGKELLSELGEEIKILVNEIGKFLDWLTKQVGELWEVFKPIGITGLEIFGYFIFEYQQMAIHVEKLNKERAH